MVPIGDFGHTVCLVATGGGRFRIPRLVPENVVGVGTLSPHHEDLGTVLVVPHVRDGFGFRIDRRQEDAAGEGLGVVVVRPRKGHEGRGTQEGQRGEGVASSVVAVLHKDHEDVELGGILPNESRGVHVERHVCLISKVEKSFLGRLCCFCRMRDESVHR